jgi:hypothetical protein
MTSRIFAPNRFVAAASATVLVAISASFVSSSARLERDPFRTEVRMAQWHGGTGSICPNNPDASDPRAPVCLRA